MYWKLFLDQQKGMLELWSDSKVLATRTWEEKKNTGKDILVALKSIQQEHNFEWSQVPKFELELDLSPHATARRIAETFQNTYNTFAV